VRENRDGQCFFHRMAERSLARRQAGGDVAEDDATDADAPPEEADASLAEAQSGTSAADDPSQRDNWWLNANSKYARFFDQQFPNVTPIAARLGVDPALLLGLSAHESTWGTSKMALDKHNPFGATPQGDNTAGLSYPSFSAAWQAWARRWGPRVQNVGSNADAFLNALGADNRHVYGPTVGGDRHGGYNTDDLKWHDHVKGAIQGVRRRLPRWQGNLDSYP
jgi:hypothetical protein